VNKVDRALLEQQLPPEDLYQTFRRAIESVNAVISTYTDSAMGDLQVQLTVKVTLLLSTTIEYDEEEAHHHDDDQYYHQNHPSSFPSSEHFRVHLQVDPVKGTVAFGSGEHQWGYQQHHHDDDHLHNLRHPPPRSLNKSRVCRWTR
jgi:translation elongation factor EF-G